MLHLYFQRLFLLLDTDFSCTHYVSPVKTALHLYKLHQTPKYELTSYAT